MSRILTLCVTASLVCLILGFRANGQVVNPKVVPAPVVPAPVDPKQMKAAQAQLAKQLEASKAGLTAQQKQVIAKLDAGQRKAAQEQLRLLEVTGMRQAYELLDMANADYNGHRASAMHHLNHAINNLESNIVRNGSTAQVKETMRQESIRGYYKYMRKKMPAVIEPQVISDAQVYQAGQILSQLRVILALNNQKRNLQHIDNSLIEVIIALGTI